MKTTLTQNFIDQHILVPKGKSKIDYFDSKQKGLLLKVLPSGTKSYYLRYKNDRSKIAEKKIADATILKLSDARSLAKDTLAKVTMGQDPFAAKKALNTVPKVSQFIAESYLPYVQGYKRSWITDESLLRNHILPAIGELYLDQVTRSQMVNLFAKHRETHKPGSTNRVIILCRYVFNCARKWEIAGAGNNPTKAVDLYPENNKRERYLSQPETQNLVSALCESQNKQIKYIVALLLLTGARKREALDAKWSDFDQVRKQWTIEFNKSGKPRYIPIADGVMKLLEQIPRFDGCDWVFPNPKTLKPYVSIFCAWDTARTKANLADVRIHDLRHSFASYLINSGRSLYEVQHILGHTQVKTTQRYAHLSQDSLISAAETASNSVSLDFLAPTELLKAS